MLADGVESEAEFEYPPALGLRLCAPRGRANRVLQLPRQQASFVATPFQNSVLPYGNRGGA